MRVLLARLLLALTIIIACLFALANRQPVRVAIDFFTDSAPWLSVEVPLFILLFCAFFAGLAVALLARLLEQR